MLTQLQLSTFLRSWAESFKALFPEQLSLFFLITLNSLRLFFPIFFASIGFYIDILLFGLILLVVFQGHPVMLILLLAYIQSCLLEITRPTVGVKIPPQAVLWNSLRLTTIIFMLGSLVLLLPAWPLYVLTIPTCALYQPLWLSLFCFPVTLFWALFFSDSRHSLSDGISSGYRALLMLVFNFPRCLAVFLLLVGITSGWWLLCSLLPGGWGSIVFGAGYVCIVAPLSNCLFTNIYIQRVHEQFPLYYVSGTRE